MTKRRELTENERSQIRRIIAKGHGAPNVARLLGLNLSTIHRLFARDPNLKPLLSQMLRNSPNAPSFTHSEISTIETMIRSGLTQRAIAEHFDVARITLAKFVASTPSLRALQVVIRANAIKATGLSHVKLSHDRLPYIKSLLEQGWSQEKIRRKLGIRDRRAISRFIERHTILRELSHVTLYVLVVSSFRGPHFKLGMDRDGNRLRYYDVLHPRNSFRIAARFAAPPAIETAFHRRNRRYNDLRGVSIHEFYPLWIHAEINPAFSDLLETVRPFLNPTVLLRQFERLLGLRLSIWPKKSI